MSFAKTTDVIPMNQERDGEWASVPVDVAEEPQQGDVSVIATTEVAVPESTNGDVTNQPLPHDSEAELQILASILNNESSRDEIFDRLQPHDFYLDMYSAIYFALRVMYKADKSIDVPTLAEQLRRLQTYEVAGGEEVLLEIANSYKKSDDYQFNIDLLNDKTTLRSIIEFGHKLIDESSKRGAVWCTRQILAMIEDYYMTNVMANTDSNMEVIDLRNCDYSIYLKSEHWKRIQWATRQHFDNRCAVCNSPGPLDVHHRTYERRGCEEHNDVIALCRDCHDLFHKNGKLAKAANGGPTP